MSLKHRSQVSPADAMPASTIDEKTLRAMMGSHVQKQGLELTEDRGDLRLTRQSHPVAEGDAGFIADAMGLVAVRG